MFYFSPPVAARGVEILSPSSARMGQNVSNLPLYSPVISPFSPPKIIFFEKKIWEFFSFPQKFLFSPYFSPSRPTGGGDPGPLLGPHGAERVRHVPGEGRQPPGARPVAGGWAPHAAQDEGARGTLAR